MPVLRTRIGLDGLISLLPVGGDAVGAVLSSYLMAEAAGLGAPKTVLIRMALNVVIDTLLGMVPVVGDLFDFAWKSNSKNIRLLEGYTLRPDRVRRSSGLFVWGLILGMLILVAVLLWLGLMLLGLLWERLFG